MKDEAEASADETRRSQIEVNMTVLANSFALVGQLATKAVTLLMILHGGATVAILVFIGHLIDSGTSVSGLVVPACEFSIGAALSVVVAVLGYVAQRYYTQSIQSYGAALHGYGEHLDAVVSWNRTGDTVSAIACLIAFVSIVLFIHAVVVVKLYIDMT